MIEKLELKNTSFEGFKSLRNRACEQLRSRRISINKYNELFNTITYANISYDKEGFFILADKGDATDLTKVYSRAKHGSMQDIVFLADKIVSSFLIQFDNLESSIYKLFQSLDLHSDILVLIVPGSRNIESSSNVIFDIALSKINIFLTKNNYPTIINVKIPRLDPPVENYASLSQEEREDISKIRDHILPASNFYKNRNIHLFFGDDVLITGSTADKVVSSALLNGAKSFHSIYAVVIDPVLVDEMPEIENVLNTSCLKGNLCKDFVTKVCSEDIIPVMKTYNILLSANNYIDLKNVIADIPIKALDKLYIYAMNNGYNLNKKYKASLLYIESYLHSKHES
jgi:hypothetical protein